MGRKQRKELRYAKKEVKKANKGVKKATANYRLASNRRFMKVYKPVTEAEKQYVKKKSSAQKAIAKDALKRAKLTRKKAVKRKKVAIDRNGGSLKRRLGKKAYQTGRSSAESTVSDNEVLEDVASARQNIRRYKAEVDRSKRIARYSYNISKTTGRGAYNVGNRTYNLAKGRGFTRTAVNNRWEVKVADKLKKIKVRIRSNKFVQGAEKVGKIAGHVLKPLKSILTNPLSIKAYVTSFLLICIVALFAGNNSAVEQDEFELTRSWLHVSKIDREKSSDTVEYWTDIDSIMTWMNFKYKAYELDDVWNDSGAYYPGKPRETYKDALASIWRGLNKDENNLKTMKDLYSKGSSLLWMVLQDDELAEYNELLELGKENGTYLNYQELDNPISPLGEEKFDQPLVITKRFGYISTDEIYNNTILQASRGNQLYATMTGTATVSEDSITIESSQAKFTYYNVSEIRVKTGDSVTAGQEIARVGSDEGQEISYQKLRNDESKDKSEWVYVNVGFYFPIVHYNQTTSVLSPIDFSGDMATRIRETADYVKKYEPNATINGISSMLGNFWTESSITAKRAEGDYLSPPVGASANSWDDPEWLSIGGLTIYGRYPNIIRRGIGLGQWTDTADGSIRHTLLRDYAQSKGKKWYDLELQIDFIFNGDSPYYREIARQILTSNEDVATLTERFLVQWEGNAGDKLLERQNNAKQVSQYLNRPAGGSSSLVASWNFPEAYRSKISNYPSQATVSSTAIGSGYPIGQCTWYSYNRLVELGKITDLSGAYGYLGNGQDWVNNLVSKGWKRSSVPVVGAVVSTLGGFDGTSIDYGHVGIVEVVNPDGSFLVSECNWGGIQDKIHWRVCLPSVYYSFAVAQ
ncbi:TPA: phage tail tip lysozyme [Streptococcus suis]